jgi:predicted Zn-dependent protease
MLSWTEILVIIGIVVAIVRARSLFRLGLGKSLGLEPLGPTDETAIGREWLLELGGRQKVTIERDPRVERIMEVLQATGRFRFPQYLVFRLDSPAINAMALPGGHVLTTRGLMEISGLQEDELAGILAHEIGHIELGHSREALIRRNRTKALQLLLSIAGRSPGAAVGWTTSLAELGISRESELEADDFAVRLLAATGYSPAGLAAFLRRASRDAQLPDWLNFLSTHPAVNERVRRLHQHLSPAARERLAGG